MKTQLTTAVMCIATLFAMPEAWAEAPPSRNAYVPSAPRCDDLDDEILAEHFRNDQKDRAENHPQRKRRDDDRLAYVLARVEQLCTPSDHHHAAMILQHSREPAHHLLAHQLARHAGEQGHGKSKWLAGAAWDRHFVSRGLPQYFGTQFKWNDAKQLCLIHVDPAATDAARTAWGIDSIAQTYALILKNNKLSHLPPTRSSLEDNNLLCPPHVWADWSGN